MLSVVALLAGAGYVADAYVRSGRSAGVVATSANGWFSSVPGNQTDFPGATSYLVARGTTNGERWEADSLRNTGSVWLAGDGFGARFTFFTDGDIGEFGSGGDDRIAQVYGFVPYDSEWITVHVRGGPTLTTPAVATPTSTSVRFFAVAYPARYLDHRFTVTGTTDTGSPIPRLPSAPSPA